MFKDHWSKDPDNYLEYEAIFTISIKNKIFADIIKSHEDLLSFLFPGKYEITPSTHEFVIWMDDSNINSDGELDGCPYFESPYNIRELYLLLLDGMRDLIQISSDSDTKGSFVLLSDAINANLADIIDSTECALWVLRSDAENELEMFIYDKEKKIESRNDYSSYDDDEEDDW